ncbi:hypothetical protein JCM30204_03910 [Dysgonomonas termitidis]
MVCIINTNMHIKITPINDSIHIQLVHILQENNIHGKEDRIQSCFNIVDITIAIDISTTITVTHSKCLKALAKVVSLFLYFQSLDLPL